MMYLDPNVDVSHYLRACTCTTNVHALTDLCTTCPIPEVINALLPETEAEIQMHRLADSPAGFRTHCQERLTHYANEAGLYASKLTTPPETHGGFTPEWIWYKFYCLALCKLYKAALKPMPERQKTAKLDTLSEPDVKAIFQKVGMGGVYTKPGEWAAALRALAVAGVLIGNAPEAARWAVAQGYVKETIYETIKKAWDLTEASQFSTARGIAVFKAVTVEINGKKLYLDTLRSK